jgi:hypothetical protein
MAADPGHYSSYTGLNHGSTLVEKNHIQKDDRCRPRIRLKTDLFYLPLRLQRGLADGRQNLDQPDVAQQPRAIGPCSARQPLQADPLITLQKLPRLKVGSLSLSTPALPLPKVMSGSCLMPSWNAWMISSLNRPEPRRLKATLTPHLSGAFCCNLQPKRREPARHQPYAGSIGPALRRAKEHVRSAKR